MGALSMLAGGAASAQDQNVNGAVNYTASLSVPLGQTVQIASGSAFNATYSLRATATGYSDAIIFSVIAQKGAGPAYVTILSQKYVGTLLLVNPRVLESGSGAAMHLVIDVNVPASVTLVGGATGTQTNLALSTTLPTFDNPNVTTTSSVVSSYGGAMGVGTAYPATTLQVTAGGNVGGAGGEIGISANFDRAPMFSIKGSLLGTGSGGDSGNIYFNMRSADNVALAPVMTLLRNGNVGVGTTSPSSRLHLKGNRTAILVQEQDAQMPADLNSQDVGGILYNDGFLRDTVMSAPAAYLKIRSVNTNVNYPEKVRGTQLEFGTADGGNGQGTQAATRLTITPAGNVGVGVTNPTTKFQVGSGLSSFTDSVALINTANVNTSALTLSNWTGSAATYGTRIAFDNSMRGVWYAGTADGSNYFDIARTWGTPDLRIGSTGNVGIGTGSAAPQSRLDLLGSSASNPGRVTLGDNGSSLPEVSIFKWSGTAATSYGGRLTTDGVGNLQLQTAPAANLGSHTFTPALTIVNSNGSVGIGTTTVDTGVKLQVAGFIKAGNVISESSAGPSAYYGRQVGSTFTHGTAAVFHGVTDNTTAGAPNWLISGYRGSEFKWGVTFDGVMIWPGLNNSLYLANDGGLKTDARFSAGLLSVSGSASMGVTSVTSLTAANGVTTGTIYGDSQTGLDLRASGMNQSITLKPSGTGEVKLVSPGTNGGSATAALLRITNTASGVDAAGGLAVGLDTDGAAKIWSHTAGKGLLFGVADAERARLTAAGNLLLGTTTETAAAGRLQIGSNADVTSASGIVFGTDSNLYRSAVNSLKTNGKFSVGTRLLVGAAADDATLALSVAGAGKFTDRLTLSSVEDSASSAAGALVVVGGAGIAKNLNVSGTVGLGTAATTTNRLEVSGDSKFTGSVNVTAAATAASLAVTNNATIGGSATIATLAVSNTATINGQLTAASVKSLTGTIAGGDATGLTLTAGGGVNANVTINSNGTGSVNIGTQGGTGSVYLGSDTRNVVVSNLLPSSATKDIGSSTQKWRSAYFSGTVTADSLIASSGSIAGGATSGLTLSAGGTGDKNIALNPTGAGYVQVGTSAGGASLGIGAAPKAPLTVRVVDQDSLAVYGPTNNVVALQTVLDDQPLTTYGTYGGDENRMVLQPLVGSVGIGTSNTSTYKLAVNGTIRAKELVVDTGWSDYVFDPNYRNAPLSEVEAHIKDHRHLPGVPSAAEVEEKGVTVGKMQSILLAKVEELTLHLIEQEKRLKRLEEENSALRAGAVR